MKKYNNNLFTNANSSMGDATMRFNKRPRYGGGPNNNSGATRYPHHNQTSYQQYSQNRNNVTETYQSSPNQFESSSRQFYGQSLSNRPPAPTSHSHAMQNQALPPPPYTHNSGSAARLSPPSSVFSPTTPNTLKPPPKIQNPTANSSSTSSITTNKHPQQLHQQQQPSQHVAQNLMDNSSYYAYGYNSFYSPYTTEMMASASASASSFGMPDTMSSYMWQTITSTPPPQLPSQQMQLPLPQPPLPQQQPPVLPPLPSAEKPTALQPPPPLPTLPGNTSPIPTDNVQNKPNDEDMASRTIVKMKVKRKAMSTRYKLSKTWSEVDAAMAIKAEEANVRKLQKDIILILRFPDPEISREIVKCYSPDIESVHFQLNFAPRYCLVHLKPGTDVKKTIETLSKIPFGNGYLSVEIKQIPHKVHTTKLSEIDPYTLYVGNLPTTIACKTLKDHFPGAVRIDIGFAQRMKYTRYAFIRYKTVQQAIEAYKRMLDAEIGGRTLTIRFRRLTSVNELNKDGDAENDDVQDDVLSQSTVISEDNSGTLNAGTESSENLEHKNYFEDLESNKEKSTNDPPNKTGDLDKNNDTDASFEPNTLLTNSRDSTLETANNIIETNSCNSHNPIEATESPAATSESTTIVTQNTTLLNIKPDPDIDPDDIVSHSDDVITRFDINEDSIKQEKELATDFEFFAPANSQSCASREKSTTANDIVSIHSTIDETDTMSTMSASSLGEFLQTCQRPRVISNDIDDIIGPPPTKRNKQYSNAMSTAIKTEPFDPQSTPVEDNLPVQAEVAIKKETVENYTESVSNENAPQSDEANRRVSRRRQTRKHQKTSSNDTDDLVPPNALFLREDMQTPLTGDPEVCDNNEFFETRSKPTAQVMTAIKTEPIDTINRSKEREKNRNPSNYQHLETLSNSRTNNDRNENSLQSQKTNETTLAGDEEDLVPERNILCTRLNTHKDSNQQPFDIKLERENEDIFSTPCVLTLINEVPTNQNEDSNLSDLWNTSSLTQDTSLELSNNKDTTKKVSKSHTSIDDNDDDDIILVSDNISQQPKYSNSTSPLVLKDSSLSYEKTDLLTFTPKTTAAVTTLESCKLIPHHHHDNLDKLFEELDADSDSEL